MMIFKKKGKSRYRICLQAPLVSELKKTLHDVFNKFSGNNIIGIRLDGYS
jgi:hypothetical protein